MSCRVVALCLQFSNLCGTLYKQGNLVFTPDGNSVLSPVGNRISIFDLVKYGLTRLPYLPRACNCTAMLLIECRPLLCRP